MGLRHINTSLMEGRRQSSSGTAFRLLLHSVSSSNLGMVKKLLGSSLIGFPSRKSPLFRVSSLEFGG